MVEGIAEDHMCDAMRGERGRRWRSRMNMVLIVRWERETGEGQINCYHMQRKSSCHQARGRCGFEVGLNMAAPEVLGCCIC